MSRTFQLTLLTAAAAAAFFARTAVGPLQETMRLALVLSDDQMAVLQGPALALPVVVGAIPLGLLVDRYSRARLLMVFALLSALGSALTGLASSFALLMIARCLVGLAAQATWIAALSMLADLYAPAQRGRTTMALAVGGVVGMSSAFALGGVLVTKTGTQEWRSAMLWLTAPVVLVALLASLMREPRRAQKSAAQESTRAALAKLWGHRSAVAPLVMGLSLVAGVADGAAVVWAAPVLARNFSLAPDRVGALMATALLIGGIAGPMAGGCLADICQRSGGPQRTMIALTVLVTMSMPAALFALAPDVTLAVASLISFITLGAAINVMLTTLATLVVPGELRGLCLGVMSAAVLLFGLGLAPVAVSTLSHVTGGTAKIGVALSIVCVTTSALGAAVFAIGMRYLPGARP